MKDLNSEKVWKIVLHIDISWLLFGLSCGIFNSISEPLSQYYHWPAASSYIGICNTLYPFGALIGALTTATLIDRYGRRGGLLIMDFIFILGALVALLNSTEAIFLSRYMTGMGAGMSLSISPLFTNEFTPEEMNGKVGPWMSLFSASGFIFSYVFGLFLEVFGNHWALWMAGLQIVVIPALYQAWWVYRVQKLDTPLWYHNKNEPEKCLEALELIYSEAKAKEVHERLQNKPTGLDFPLLKNEVLTYSKVICERKFSKMLRCGFSLCIFQQFSGINAVLVYSNEMFTKMNIDKLMSRIMTLVIGFVLLGANSLSIPVLRSFGRKTIMVSCAFLLALNLTLLGVVAGFDDFSGIVKGCFIFVYLVLFSVSFGATMWIYCGEFLNEKAISLTASTNFLANCVVNFGFDFAMVNGVPLAFVFYFFAACMVVSGVHGWMDLVETRGLSRQEIEKLIQST